MRQAWSEYQGRCFTDSAPVMERHWAAEAGLGFIGKNNFLISPKYGLRTLIGVIICNIPPEWLGERKEKIAEGCGECRRCIDACPEGALYAPSGWMRANVSPTTPLSRMSSIPPALWSTKVRSSAARYVSAPVPMTASPKDGRNCVPMRRRYYPRVLRIGLIWMTKSLKSGLTALPFAAAALIK